MEIFIKDIPEEGRNLHFDSETESWFQNILTDSLAEACRKEDRGTADFHLLRTGQNVDCWGQVSCGCHPVCSRCLKVFKKHLDVPIHLTLAPLFESERQLKMEHRDEVELVKEDLEFTFYEGESFDLGAIIREQLILEIPMQLLCKEDCKGLCQTCGKNLNEGPCQCKTAHADARWTPLKKFKKGT